MTIENILISMIERFRFENSGGGHGNTPIDFAKCLAESRKSTEIFGPGSRRVRSIMSDKSGVAEPCVNLSEYRQNQQNEVSSMGIVFLYFRTGVHERKAERWVNLFYTSLMVPFVSRECQSRYWAEPTNP